MFRFPILVQLTLIVSLLGAAACGEQGKLAHSPTESQGLVGQIDQPVLTVTDPAGAPVENAKILIGLRDSVPFPGNILTTDINGTVAVPPEWMESQPVTVDAPGFVRTTWLSQSPGPIVMAIRPQLKNQRMELTGKATGFKNLKKDDWIDIGVVFPAIRKNQLASLQVTDLISPEVDNFTVMGQTLEIPSNVSIPKQTERYYVSITLDKPIYRTYLNEPRDWRMVVTHARFPFEDVVDDMRAGKKFFDVINRVEFKSATVEDISLSSPSTKKDMAIGNIKFQPKIDVLAPKFDSKYAMLALAVTEQDGLLFPTDVKRLGPKETRRLVGPQGMDGYIVGALRDLNAPSSGPDADALSAVIAPTNQTTPFEFLDIPDAPKIKGSTLVISPPNSALSAVSPSATYATLSKVDARQAGQMVIDTKIPLWDVYANGWPTEIELPDLSSTGGGKGSFRWEVLFGGAPVGTSVQLGPALIDGLSHISKSAANL